MKNDINGFVFCVIIFLFILILSLILRSGRGAFLIGGYNIMPKEKKALYNERALCKMFGNLLLVVDLILVFTIIAGIYGITWLVILMVIILMAISFGTAIYAFTDDKFRK